MKRVQSRLADLSRVAPQRWLLGAWAVTAAAVATLAAGASGGGQSLLVWTVVIAFAVGAALRPATHTALGVVVVVTWQWLVTTDDALSPLVVVVAAALLLFHVLIALAAVTPTAAELDRRALTRWAGRVAMVAVATLALWGTVLLLDQRGADGSVLATFTAFVTVAALLTAMRLYRMSPDRAGD